MVVSNKQASKNSSNLIRINSELHRLLKIKAATEKTTLKALIEKEITGLLEAAND